MKVKYKYLKNKYLKKNLFKTTISHEQYGECIICDDGFTNKNPKICVGEKGMHSLLHSCEIRKDKIIEERLKFAIQNNTPILVHKMCRRNFTDEKRSLKASETNSHPSHEPQRKRLRSSIKVCDLKSQCLFCGKKAPTDKKNAERNPIHIVTFVEVHINVLKKCRKRNDTWGDEVYVRLSCSNDLVADKGRYHKTCLQRFMTDKKTPDLEDEENRERGRPAEGGDATLVRDDVLMVGNRLIQY